ncbi:MAG: hypothetical protein NTV94_14905 [Planctomycetota bacterium]|nr:hypothetical protein [Planctomycetota bacterium]
MGAQSELTCWHCGARLESAGARCTSCVPPVSAIELELPLYTINTHVRCVRCGYDLHGLPVEGACAECECPVRRSLELDSLGNSDPHYLRSLYLGATLFCAGCAFGAGSSILSLAASYWRVMRFPQTLSFLIWIFTVLVMYSGFYFLSCPDPAQRGARWSPDSRVLARVLLMLLLIAQLFMMMQQLNSAVVGFNVPAGLMMVVMVLLQAAFLGACAAYVRGLFVRIGRHARAEVAQKFIWQLPILCGVGFCIPTNVVCQILLLGLLWPLRKDLAAMLQHPHEAPATQNRYAP